MSSVLILMGAGLVGYLMKIAGWPRPPLLLGFVLGPVMEESLSITAQSYSSVFAVLQRPTIIALVLVLGVLATIAIRSVLKQQNTVSIESSRTAPAATWLSIILALVALGMFIYGFTAATGWTFLSRLFPMVICAAGVPLALAVIWKERGQLTSFAKSAKESAGEAAMNAREFWAYQKPEVLVYLGFLVLVAVMPILGLAASLVAFTAVYLVVWGRYGWKATALYTACIALLLYLLYYRVLHTAFMPSIFGW